MLVSPRAIFLIAIAVGLLIVCTIKVYAQDGHKIVICHHTGSETNPVVTIDIDEHAWPAHAEHGDTQGACTEEPPPPTEEQTNTAPNNDEPNVAGTTLSKKIINPRIEIFALDQTGSPTDVWTYKFKFEQTSNGELRRILVDPYNASGNSGLNGDSWNPTTTLDGKKIVYSYQPDVSQDVDLVMHPSRKEFEPEFIEEYGVPYIVLSDTNNIDELDADILRTGAIVYAACDPTKVCSLMVTDLRGPNRFSMSLGVYGRFPDGSPNGLDIVFVEEGTGFLKIVSRSGTQYYEYYLRDNAGKLVVGTRPRYSSDGLRVNYFVERPNNSGGEDYFILDIATGIVKMVDRVTQDVAPNPNWWDEKNLDGDTGVFEITPSEWIYYDPQNEMPGLRYPGIEGQRSTSSANLANPEWQLTGPILVDPSTEAANASAFARNQRAEQGSQP